MDDLHSILKSFSAGSNSSLLAFDSSYKINLSDGTNPMISMQRFNATVVLKQTNIAEEVPYMVLPLNPNLHQSHKSYSLVVIFFQSCQSSADE